MRIIHCKVRHLHCPFCGGFMEPDEANVENWKCMECRKVWFINLVG